MFDARGNFCDHLPTMCLLDSQILGEMLREMYSKELENDEEAAPASEESATTTTASPSPPSVVLRSRIIATVANFNIFPFLRFCRTLQMYETVTHREIEIRWVKHTHNPRILPMELLRRLIELHWLQGFPIWSCLTKLPPPGTINTGGPMPDYLYPVRQLVALHHLDPVLWRELSITYIRRWEVIELDKPSNKDWKSVNEAEIVETVIDMVVEAAKWRIAGKGSFTCVDREGGTWSDERMGYTQRRGNIAIVYEKQHATVHLVNLYRKKVDKMVREHLGEDYEEWERMPDLQPIPQDVVL